MSSEIRDLLPDEVDLLVSDANISLMALPSKILEFQAKRLVERSKGFLQARILRTTSEIEVVLSFEIIASALDFSAILFKVRHRPDFEFPALIVPPEPLPSFLRPTVTVKKIKKGLMGTVRPFDEVEEVTEQNRWLAVTAEEFEDKVGDVFRLPQIRAIFQNLGTQSKQPVIRPSSGD